MYGFNSIPDDPVVRCMERTGYPPWLQPGWEDDEEPEEDGEEYDETEEVIRAI